MSNREELLTPVGRLVSGSLYEPKVADANGIPLVVKSGPNVGQPRCEYYFAVAIPKGTEQHWSQTTWGAIIYKAGLTGYPNGQVNSPTFAWKITDGDSTVPNQKGIKPCSREGYAGHWILNFSGGQAPGIVSADGSKYILEKDTVNLGDYIQVFGNVTDNVPSPSPGVYLNHKFVAFAGYGERITMGPDPKSVGFGGTLPSGASAIPLTQGFMAPVVATGLITPPQVPISRVPIADQPAATIVPYPEILTPPMPPQVPISAPPVVQHQMTEKAAPYTYEQYIAAGWSDAKLIADGRMLP